MDPVRRRIRVEGTVQGVGFRPFVYGLAIRDGLSGLVGNDAGGVFIEVEGPATHLDRFQSSLRTEAPPLAVVDHVTAHPVPAQHRPGFHIALSAPDGDRREVAPDAGICADCRRELADPADRRYRYAFINCTNCGPRFTIVRDVPYDRPNTTMASFAMCARCRAEYDDPANRRFHAQPICCPDCGPTLRLWPAGESDMDSPTMLDGSDVDASAVADRSSVDDDDPIAVAARLLRAGGIVAVKGLGGYHLAVSARSAAATARLRACKLREDKPFAVMVADLNAARALGRVDATEADLLSGPGRPIVLLRLAAPDVVAPAVAPGHGYLGVMLPYTPVHVLLLAAFGGPLVLTSGNLSDEPIVYRDEDAASLAPVADAFLSHDRPIHIRTDDSVVRALRGQPLMLRRARGYAPAPIRLARPVRRPVLGCGAELKNTFCLATADRAILSPHIGDLANYETYRSYVESIAHLRRLYAIVPELVAYDLHPEYLSSKYALSLTDTPTVGVQHHHAHIAACLVDNDHSGPVIGVAFDGLGYGPDGTLWGGEFLAADLTHADRLGHLAPVALPGGTAAVREPWRMALSYLDAAGRSGDVGPGTGTASAIALRHADHWPHVQAIARVPQLSPPTSSAGRLFDAVSALVTGRDTVSYEGQAAIGLEQLALTAAGGPGHYAARLVEGDPFTVVGADLVAAAVSDLDRATPPAEVALRVHRGFAALIADGCELAHQRTGLSTVALSGGVFQNVLLLELAVTELDQRGLRVLTHHRVPPNDGGISLGQVAIAAARD